jgi:hypothetical protein
MYRITGWAILAAATLCSAAMAGTGIQMYGPHEDNGHYGWSTPGNYGWGGPSATTVFSDYCGDPRWYNCCSNAWDGYCQERKCWGKCPIKGVLGRPCATCQPVCAPAPCVTASEPACATSACDTMECATVDAAPASRGPVVTAECAPATEIGCATVSCASTSGEQPAGEVTPDAASAVTPIEEAPAAPESPTARWLRPWHVR